MPASARIAPLEPPYEPEIADMLRRWMPPDAAGIEPLALFRTLAVHPELCSRMRPLGAAILAHGLVGPREREIVIHRACARAGAAYEWGVHAVAFAPRVGLTDGQLRATATGGPDDPVWDETGAWLIRMVDELHDDCRVSEATWSGLAARFTPAQLLELVVTAGWYRLIAGVINGLGIQPEPWGAAMPS